MNVNDAFIIDYVTSQPDWQSLRVLDYGCGKGELVRGLRDAGVEAYGTEIADSYADRDADNVDTADKGWFRTFQPGEDLPFEAGFFDLIISKMVFEHIPDKASAFGALRRVLAPTGRMYHQFPTREVVRETHIGLPFAHWWRPGSRTRHAYVRTMAQLGFGTRKGKRIGMTPAEWTEHSLAYIDGYTYYEPYDRMVALFGEHFDIVHNEIDYCRFRARNQAGLRELLDVDVLAPVYERLFRRVAFMAVELRPKAG